VVCERCDASNNSPGSYKGYAQAKKHQPQSTLQSAKGKEQIDSEEESTLWIYGWWGGNEGPVRVKERNLQLQIVA
jgi:hypothetical protein